ncbi:MAG TPA: sugar phosphate isomerase/epimerase [Rhizomicrobium sp.]|jgi:sugar phosphate isomerase/epimerase
MTPRFSLAHLTVLGCTPAQATYIAADAGYDFVSFRIIPVGLANEPRYVLNEDAAMLRETKAALRSTGMALLDIEVARISDDRAMEDYRPALEVAAELGARHVVATGYGKDKARIVDGFARLCGLARPLGLTVDLEFITFSDVSTLALVREILDAANCDNAGVLVDTLHFDRSRIQFAELDAVPSHQFHFAQLCDAARADAPSPEEMMRTAREERLYLGEGVIPVREIVARLPNIPCSLEIAHRKRQQEMGYKAFAEDCLDHARRYFAAQD